MPLRLSRCEALDGHGLSPVTKEPFLFHIVGVEAPSSSVAPGVALAFVLSS